LQKVLIQSLAISRVGYHTKFEKKVNTASVLRKQEDNLIFSTCSVVKAQPQDYLSHRKMESLYCAIMILNYERVI